jgi:uncharacterized protein (TIGR03437 family)
VLINLILAASSHADPRIPLALSRAQYRVRAGSTMKVELPEGSLPMVKEGRALHSFTAPRIEHAPFVTADAEGNLVIAAPSLAAPEVYTVSFDLTAAKRVHAASILVAVAPAASVPLGSGVPVILLNGWQPPSLTQLSTCPTSPTDGSAPFGTLPKNLPVFTTFFDNCVECPNCPIETLGADLGQRIQSLTFSDGSPVAQVDVVVHSMGGLIVRAYLSGKSQTPGVFAPPPTPRIRKAVFIGTPHFGSFLATDFGTQSTSLRAGSQFLWDLGRWNQGNDDLREIDALAIAGNASFDSASDGVVSLTSASLTFAGVPDARTRVINGCHIDGAAAFLLLCSTSQGIASSAESQQIVTSFLAGSNTWSSVGHSPSQDGVLSHTAGRFVSVVNAANTTLNSVSSMTFAGQSLSRNGDNQTIFYNDSLRAASGLLTYATQGQSDQTPATIDAGGSSTILLKSPPFMTVVRPAAAAIATLNVAPGSLISIFGTGLASNTMNSSFPWPTHLADVTVTANGQALQLLYVGGAQVNAYFPSNLSGLVSLQLTNSTGQHALGVMTANASPALFSADSSGTGIAAAIHASTGQPVTTSDPAVAGEYIELYGTGFGSTTESGGYLVTSLTPTLTVGAAAATVTFCGIPQGGIGLYQLNFIVPGGLPGGTSVPLAMTLGNYAGNRVTLPVR